ncbi:hypothetical protein GCM10008940_30710 [Microbulbifer agarilyticus]
MASLGLPTNGNSGFGCRPSFAASMRRLMDVCAEVSGMVSSGSPRMYRWKGADIQSEGLRERQEFTSIY